MTSEPPPLPKRQPGKAGRTEKKLSGKRDVQKKTGDKTDEGKGK